MLVFDRWGPLAEGSESREDNPYALDATEGGGAGLDDSEPPSPAEGEGSGPARRWSMVVSSDDEMEDSDAGPQASPPQRAQTAAEGDAGEAQGHHPEALAGGPEATSGSGEASQMVPPRAASL